jgi:hypothetical protein
MRVRSIANPLPDVEDLAVPGIAQRIDVPAELLSYTGKKGERIPLRALGCVGDEGSL